MLFGSLIGIIYGLYFNKSIAFVLLVSGIIYYIFLKKHNKLRYLKILLNWHIVLVVLISAFISNTYVLYLNYRYNSFYKNAPKVIEASAVVVRRLSRKRIF